MRYARPTKHYRVSEAERQYKDSLTKGTYIATKDKPKLYLVAGAMATLIFVFGLLIGAVINKD